MMVREEVIRPYDGKIVVWERRNMPELVKDSKRIMKKDYYDPHFWVMVEVRLLGRFLLYRLFLMHLLLCLF